MRSVETVAGMPCPVCKTGLTMSDRSGVEIDFCPTCRGVWLDRGELDKIIERSEPPARSPELPRETGHSFGRDREFAGDYRKKRKKSFLHELFD